jgi:hypothetical protein
VSFLEVKNLHVEVEDKKCEILYCTDQICPN